MHPPQPIMPTPHRRHRNNTKQQTSNRAEQNPRIHNPLLFAPAGNRQGPQNDIDDDGGRHARHIQSQLRALALPLPRLHRRDERVHLPLRLPPLRLEPLRLRVRVAERAEEPAEVATAATAAGLGQAGRQQGAVAVAGAAGGAGGFVGRGVAVRGGRVWDRRRCGRE